MTMNEAETRAEHIDPALQVAGWGVVEGSRIRREFHITLGRLQGGGVRGKPEIADYVLEYRNTALAVVEAKAWDRPYTEGVAQAKSYAAKLAVRFSYATNGRQIYAIDMDAGHEGDVVSFPTPDELWASTFAQANAWRDRFAAVSTPDKSGSWQPRFYQEIAVNRVLEALIAGQRRILLTLATGTGKTSIAFQIAWKLFRARWNASGEPTRQPRILFLADRNTLANQAFNDFNAFAVFAEDALLRIDPASIRKKGSVPTNGSVFFTIFQTFMSGPPKEGKPSPYFGEYPADFFDFIVIDECHRGGASDESSWRDILDYFAPAVQLGLTATPKRNTNVDTYAYFGEPVYIYSLKDGINDGFLTPFKVRQIATTLDDYIYTSDDKLIQGEIEPGKRYGEDDFNRIIQIREREVYRVKLWLDAIGPREKTLVFCATQEHALLVRDLVNQASSSTDPLYCVRVTANDGALGDQYLADFRDNEKTIPTVLTTSRKLSTGVDARNVRNIVLMRPVKDMVEFKQIIGRGTRLYDGKEYFTIYDFVKAYLHFSDPEWDGEPAEPEPCGKCGAWPCVCETKPAPVCVTCGQTPCACEKPPCPKCGKRPCECVKKIKVKLADGKERTIQHMSSTSFWSADGTPMSAAEFLKSLYGALPEFFRDEDELRAIWSAPDTRKALLQGLADKGFGKEPMAEIQRVIDAQHSDLFDVLAYIAFTLPPITREERVVQARPLIGEHFGYKQAEFIDFVLAQYVRQGVDELDSEKLAPMLRLKYHAIADATQMLGDPQKIRGVFDGFQRYLYCP
jgi:type I restriction enzyme, R subunit